MRKKILFLLTIGLVFTALTGCRDTSTTGTEPESSESVTKETETEPSHTIFDQVVAGEPINDLKSLFNISETVRIQDYYAVGANTHGDKEIMILYRGEEDSLCVVYDIASGKEKARIEMDVELSLNAVSVGVNTDFSYIREENGTFIYLDWKNEEYEIIQLEAVPKSYLILGEGETIYYTLEDDCNVYAYIYGSERSYSVYDGSDEVSSLELRYLISAGTSIILYVESEGYTGYAQLSLELQELTVFDSLSGKLIYNDNEYLYTVPDKPKSILLYDPMTPRLSKEFRIENEEEIEQLTFYRDEELFLTKVTEDGATVIRFYDLNAGILKNQLIIPENIIVTKAEYFEHSLCVFVECRDENGEYYPLIWNTDIIEEILE